MGSTFSENSSFDTFLDRPGRGFVTTPSIPRTLKSEIIFRAVLSANFVSSCTDDRLYPRCRNQIICSRLKSPWVPHNPSLARSLRVSRFLGSMCSYAVPLLIIWHNNRVLDTASFRPISLRIYVTRYSQSAISALTASVF